MKTLSKTQQTSNKLSRLEVDVRTNDFSQQNAFVLCKQLFIKLIKTIGNRYVILRYNMYTQKLQPQY